MPDPARRSWPSSLRLIVLSALLLAAFTPDVQAQTPASPGDVPSSLIPHPSPLAPRPSPLAPRPSQIQLPATDPSRPVAITAEAATRWVQGAYEVWVLGGKCRIEQGADSATSREAVAWVRRGDPIQRQRSLVIVYLEGDVSLDLAQNGARARLTDQSWLGRFETGAGVEVYVPQVRGPAQTPPAIYQRAVAARDLQVSGGVQQAQYTQPIPSPGPSGLVPPDGPLPPGGPLPSGGSSPPSGPIAPGGLVPPGGPLPPGGPPAASPAPTGSLAVGARRIRAFARGEMETQIHWFPDRQTGQWIAVIEGGVNLIVEDIPLPGDGRLSRTLGLPGLVSIGLWADRMVIWTRGQEVPDIYGNKPQATDTPFEIYMEGNIVFREGDRVLYADRMYYDVNNQVGAVLGAELLTPVPRYEGLVRLRAQILRQLGPNRFEANDAFFTSSRLGSPTYRLQAESLSFEDVQEPRIDPVTGQPAINPQTLEAEIDHRQLATSENNWLYLDDLPVFYWPKMVTDLKESSFYIRRVRVRNDNVYGLQILTDWNAYQLLGIRNRPEGTDWGLSLDEMTKRGFGHGTDFRYSRDDFLGIAGKAVGVIDYWGIPDHGNDNLGLDRRDIPPERDYRYRLFARHRQMLEGDIQFSAEVGWISDRNFLESYFEREWDEMKDQVTALELKKIRDNTSWSISAAARINDFFTQTDWLPRLDHFWLGQPVLNNALTWYEHSSAAYAQFHTLSLPPAAQEQPPAIPQRYLPWEVSPAGQPLSTQSERFVTRQEIDWPLQLGPLKVVPYALGEAAHWGEARDGEDLQRLYGQAGLRASIPAWRVNPDVESMLWNVHGLAHKVVFDAEAAWADSNRSVEELPLYDPLDDDAIENFRRLFVPWTFPSPGTLAPTPAIPRLFDERFYAVRTGMAGWVTAPSTEIAEDLMFVRLGMRNRWQTKRGTPGNERIVDWITVDTNITFFPEKSRDNFGELVGLLDYDARWQVGDRLALLSSGVFDFFQNGQRLVTVGAFLERPPKGSLYVGVHLLDGPVSNTILAMSYTYRMSPKWVSAFGTTVDLRDQGNIGQHLSITRVGESFLVSAGFNFDASRGNWGAGLAIEPRFLPKTRLGQAGGARIPVAGAYGLE